MNKLFKGFMALILVFIISIFGIVNVNAKSAMVLNKVTYIKSGVGNRTETGFITNKGYAYCISPTKTTPPNGTKLYYKGNINDGGLLYLLKQANKSNKSVVLTRIAVWKYYNGYMVSAYRNHPNASVVKQANALVTNAKKNKNNLDKNPSVKASISSKAMNEYGGGKYYKSKAITIKLSNVSSGKVSVTSPATVWNANDKRVTTVKNGDKVYVSVPASNVTKTKSYTLKVEVSKNVTHVEKYTPNNSKYQSLVVLGTDKKSDSAKVVVTATPAVRTCTYANGKYYGKNGNVVDYTTYDIECNEHVCQQVGDVYFGKDGTQVSAETFNLECNEHRCEIIGDKHFGKNGTEVDEATYDIECNQHKCQKVGDIYFGKNGNQVDQATFDLECNQHICEKIGDKYFGKDGVEVDEATYKADCVHTCQKIGDKYYGLNGDVVTEAEYKNQCVHTCEINDGKYYGKDGNEVTEEEYQNECESQVVSVPDTGTTPFTTILLTLLGLGTVGTAAGIVIRNQKING